MCLLQSYLNLLRIIVSNLIIVDADQIAKNYFRADKFIYLKFLPQFWNMHRLASDLTVFFVTEDWSKKEPKFTEIVDEISLTLTHTHSDGVRSF